MQEKLDIYKNRIDFKRDFESFMSQEKPYEIATDADPKIFARTNVFSSTSSERGFTKSLVIKHYEFQNSLQEQKR